MNIEILKSKIHRVTVTGAELDYIGSITIDRALMDAANIVAGEKVQVVNVNNGERLETYVIEGALIYKQNLQIKAKFNFFLNFNKHVPFCPRKS